jgi:peroxiredoxin Q/BCP
MRALEPGDRAPDFELEDAEGNPWRLSDRRGRKVIVYFYPADDTPGCTREACDFRDSLTDFHKAGYEVVGISAQGRESHQRFASKYNLNFPLLVDKDLKVADAYSTTDDSGRTFEDIPLPTKRATFVVSEDGTLELALYKVTAKGHVESLLESLRN